MASGSVRIQMKPSHLRDFKLPAPLNGMVAKNTVMNVDDWDYYFEDEMNGNFVQISFNVRQDGEDFFIVGKFTATTQAILDEYMEYYKNAQEKFPMDLARLKKLPVRITSKLILKERIPELVKHFSQKRRGKYIGIFTDPRDKNQGVNKGAPQPNK